MSALELEKRPANQPEPSQPEGGGDNQAPSIPEVPAQAEALSRREFIERLVGKESVLEAQKRFKEYGERLNQSITDPEVGIHENTEVLQGAAMELWLLKRAGRTFVKSSEEYKELLIAANNPPKNEIVTDKQAIAKAIDRHVGVLAKTLDTGRISDEDVLALQRLSYVGALTPERQKQIKKGLENILTNPRALKEYAGDVTTLLLTARQAGLFEKGELFISGKGTQEEIRQRVREELQQVGRQREDEDDDVRASTRLALRRMRLRAIGLESLVPEAEEALPNEKLEAACDKAAETDQVGSLARLRRAQAYLLPKEKVQLPELEKKKLLGAVGNMQRQFGRTRRYLRFAGDLIGVFKKEPVTVAEVAAMGDLEKQSKTTEKKQPAVEQKGRIEGIKKQVEQGEQVENIEKKLAKKVEEKKEETDDLFKKIFGQPAAAGAAEQVAEDVEEEEGKGVLGKVWEAIKKFFKWLWKKLRPPKVALGGVSLGRMGEAPVEQVVDEVEWLTEEEAVGESSGQGPAKNIQKGVTQNQRETQDGLWQTQEFVVTSARAETLERKKENQPVTIKVEDGDKTLPIARREEQKNRSETDIDEILRTKTYLVDANGVRDEKGNRLDKKKKDEDDVSGQKRAA